MSVSAQAVKELRDKTGAGMMDCKKALSEANGDFEKAIELLRKRGASVAAKRADRSANEGVVLTKVLSDDTVVILEVNCETDFVAKNSDFLEFANFVLDTIATNKPANKEELNNYIIDRLNETTGKVGEKVDISRFIIEKAENGIVVDYIHHGAKLGVLIRIDNVTNSIEEVKSLAKDFAMQVAAMNPLYVNETHVPKEVIEKEIEIYKELSRKEGKPEQILEKIALGRLNKFYEEVCLANQKFIKENSKSINEVLEDFNQKSGSSSKLVAFHRISLSDENK